MEPAASNLNRKLAVYIIAGLFIVALITLVIIFFITGKTDLRKILTGSSSPTPVVVKPKSPELSVLDNQKKINKEQNIKTWKIVIDNKDNKTDALKSVQITNMDFSNGVIKWLDSMKNSDGIYDLGEMCTSDGKCDQRVRDNRVGVATIWARYKYFEKTGDQNQLNILDKDLETYANKVNPIQNYFWNCKLMYELYQSNLLTQEEKNKAKTICYKSKHFLPSLEIIEKNITNNKDSGLNFAKILNNNFSFTEDNIEKDKFFEYATATSDYISRYYWENKAVDLEIAKWFFNYAVNAYYQSKSQGEDVQNKWLLAIASFDLWQVTGDGNYKDFTLVFHDEAEKNNDFCKTVFSCSVKSDYYNSLYKKLNRMDFKSKRDSIFSRIIEIGFVKKEMKGFLLDKKAFREFNKGDVFYSTLDNSYTLGLINVFFD